MKQKPAKQETQKNQSRPRSRDLARRYTELCKLRLVDERRRLDALSDLQRYKGCTVMEPGPAVVEERARLEGSVVGPQTMPPAVVLKSRG